MSRELHKKLLQKEMTRGEFIKFLGGSLFVLLGLTNVLALLSHFAKTADTPKTANTEARHGFGSRKFGV